MMKCRLHNIKKKKKPVLVCDGGSSVVHVEDVADGIVAAMTKGRAGERYILGGDNLTIRQLAELTRRHPRPEEGDPAAAEPAGQRRRAQSAGRCASRCRSTRP